MPDVDLELAIKDRGRQFFADIRDEKPSLFSKGRWIGAVMDWAMRHEAFKVQLFRFVDVFPSLTTGAALARHVEEYFGGDQEVPDVLRWDARAAGLGSALGGQLLGAGVRTQVEGMARQFIIGQDTAEAVKTLGRLRQEGFAAVVDFLGESTEGEGEADVCLRTYLELVEALRREQLGWVPLTDAVVGSGRDWGYAPKLQISVKPTSLYSQANPMDFEGSVRGILTRLRPLYEAVADAKGFLCIDMESSVYKDITGGVPPPPRRAPAAGLPGPGDRAAGLSPRGRAGSRRAPRLVAQGAAANAPAPGKGCLLGCRGGNRWAEGMEGPGLAAQAGDRRMLRANGSPNAGSGRYLLPRLWLA
jgi:RHH-type proline utilization regulon transcriptional repressor/proline dehydrogenase/delta 1-pyrroline-5-carboxylate dehydrogenase